MAQFALHGGWKSVAALACLLTFLGLLTFSMAGGLAGLPDDEAGTDRRVQFGLILYAVAFATMVFGFWSKEDVIAIAGIIALSGLVILDILLRVGVLSFNHVHVI
jgi:hypothetical protein